MSEWLSTLSSIIAVGIALMVWWFERSARIRAQAESVTAWPVGIRPDVTCLTSSTPHSATIWAVSSCVTTATRPCGGCGSTPVPRRP